MRRASRRYYQGAWPYSRPSLAMPYLPFSLTAPSKTQFHTAASQRPLVLILIVIAPPSRLPVTLPSKASRREYDPTGCGANFTKHDPSKPRTHLDLNPYCRT